MKRNFDFQINKEKFRLSLIFRVKHFGTLAFWMTPETIFQKSEIFPTCVFVISTRFEK